jgi:cytochrome c oxidase assembly protein subunit 11
LVCSVDIYYMALDQEPKELNAKQQLDVKNKRLVKKLLWLLLGSLLFAFSLVPLYNVLCDLTGLNVKKKQK